MLVQLPGGTAIDATGDIVSADDNGEIRLHTQQALSRLIEFWKTKPNLRALLADYIDEIQEAENMLWDVIVKRLIAYAEFSQLDVLGKLVGETRDGRTDAQYRVRINARIAINNSRGRAPDIIRILRLLYAERFRFSEDGVAQFRIEYLTPLANTAGYLELPGIVSEARIGGVGAKIIFALDANQSLFWNSDYGGITQLSNNVWGSDYGPDIYGRWAYDTKA